MSLAILKTIGLTDKETEIYDLLMQKGEVPVGVLLDNLKMKRPTVYKSLYELEKKGLVSKRDIAKKIHFRPEPPTNILTYLAQREKEHERVTEDVRSLIPQLTSSYILAVEKPVVSTFEGIKGLKEIYEDTLRERKEILAVLQTGEVDEEMFKWLTTTYAKKRAKLKIKAKVIVASGKWSESYQSKNEKEYRETVLVPSNTFPFRHEVDVYGNKVAFINYKKGEKLIGVVINHPQIAETMRAILNLGWIGAAEIQKRK